MVKKNLDTLEIGDDIVIIINFKYYHHLQNNNNKDKCKLKIKELSNQSIKNFINTKLLKILNKWIDNLYYGSISNKTKKLKIPSIEIKFTKSNIKNIDINKKEFITKEKVLDNNTNNSCYYKNSKDVKLLIVTKLRKSSLKLEKLITELDLPSLQSINKNKDNPNGFFNIVKDAIFHHSSSHGSILDNQERHNLVVDNIGFKVFKTDKIFF